MRSIKNFKLFTESEDSFDAGVHHNKEVEVGVYKNVCDAIDNLEEALDEYVDFEEGEEFSEGENEDLFKHDERELEILGRMKDLVIQLKDLKSELLNEENEEDADEVEAGITESRKHPGFKSVASKIAKRQGISKEKASAILAASSRKASAKAKRKNPRLKNVGGCTACNK